jgi:hypothetical protein
MIILKYLSYWALLLKYRCFVSTWGSRNFFMWQNFAGPPIGSPVNPTQLCCQGTSVYRDINGCLCTVLLFIGRTLIESAANPASYRACIVFAFLLCVNYRVLLFRFLLLSSTGTSHAVTKTARSDMSCPTLNCCAEPSLYRASFQQVFCVLCFGYQFVTLELLYQLQTNYLPCSTTCTPSSRCCSSTILFAVFRRVHKISKSDC